MQGRTSRRHRHPALREQLAELSAGGLLLVQQPLRLLDLLSIIQTSANLSKAAGWVTMGFTAVAVYAFLSSAWHATGGKEFPLGRPFLRT